MAGEENFAATVGHVDAEGVAHRLGLRTGDVVLEINGVRPRDILEWRRLADQDEIELVVDRGGVPLELSGRRQPAEPFGASVESALFDRIHTCDNHCEFCFIYQLPKGLRRSLYTKDDDYRLSFLFGNFTTLTRFTEADLERVVNEALSPLHVSVHATDPVTRAAMLRNPRGGTSLRWLGELLDAGIDVKLQIVLCPGVNDGPVLDDTLADIAETYPTVSEIAVVPLGLSRHNTEARMRVHEPAEAAAAIDQIDWWRAFFMECRGRPLVHAADEFYVACGRPFPEATYYGRYSMVEDGIGLARSFAEEFRAGRTVREDPAEGFFSALEASPPRNPSAYTTVVRAPRPANPAGDTALRGSVRRAEELVTAVDAPVRRARHEEAELLTVVTGSCAVELIRSLTAELDAEHVDVLEVCNDFFGGNTSVAGLLCGEDLARAIGSAPQDRTYLIPDVCLNDGRFLDGGDLADLRDAVGPRRVEVVGARGHLLRRRLESRQTLDRRGGARSGAGSR